MKIATFNVNSLRKRLPIVLDWLASRNPMCSVFKKLKSRTASFRCWHWQNPGTKSPTGG